MILLEFAGRRKEGDSKDRLEKTGVGWNKFGIHTVDSYQIDDTFWLACVDGKKSVFWTGIIELICFHFKTTSNYQQKRLMRLRPKKE